MRPEPEKKQVDKKVMYGNLLRLLCLIALTMVVFCVYRFLSDKYFFDVVLTVYMVIAAATTFAYVIYNRGFSRLRITPEMLPDTMTEEQKREFIEDGKHRLQRSRPMLMVIFAFAFTFVVDIIELFAFPMLEGLFGK